MNYDKVIGLQDLFFTAARYAKRRGDIEKCNQFVSVRDRYYWKAANILYQYRADAKRIFGY